MATADDLKKLKDLIVNMPQEQKDAALKIIDGFDSDGDGVPDVKGLKAFFFKNGEFSKTAAFAVIGNALVLVTYFAQSWLVGATFDLPLIHGSVPAFNVESALAIMGILNGTYVSNNWVKTKTPPPAAE